MNTRAHRSASYEGVTPNRRATRYPTDSEVLMLRQQLALRKEPRYMVSGKVLGNGAYGAVHAGTARCADGSYENAAVKLIPEGRMQLEALAREAAIMERLSRSGHPSMLRFHAWLTPGSIEVHAKGGEGGEELAVKLPTSHCLVMEAVAGGELFDYIVAQRGLSEREAGALFAQIGEAVRTAHELGIAHRDLKLENVLFAREGGLGQKLLKLIDWGLAHQHEVGEDGAIVHERLHSRCGSRSYMAPEVITCTSGRHRSGSRTRDSRAARDPAAGFDAFAADVWSLGICLFAMLFGFFPFEQADASKDWRAEKAREAERAGGSVIDTIIGFYPKKKLAISPAARELLDAMLSFDPNRRCTLGGALASAWLAPHVGRLRRAMPSRVASELTPPTPTGSLSEQDDDISSTCGSSANGDGYGGYGDALSTIGNAASEAGGGERSARDRRSCEWTPRPSVALRPTGARAGVERQDTADTDTASVSSVGSSVKRSVVRLHTLVRPDVVAADEPPEAAAAPLPPHRPYRPAPATLDAPLE